MYIYTLVVATHSLMGAIEATHDHIREWDDESGGVYRIAEAALSGDQRVLLKVWTNQPRRWCERTLNGWMGVKRPDLGEVAKHGDLIWWAGMSME